MASTAPGRIATTGVQPVAPSRGALRPLGLHEVTVTGGFWARLQQLNAATIIGHAEQWMERVGWIGNFDAAVDGRLPGDRRGREFSDSDVYKLMEAMAWEIGRTDDPDLDRRFVALVDRIEPVQEPDGYLNTMYGPPGHSARYSNLEWGHELYCFGHLLQAGIARARTHGDDRFVAIARRAADHVCAAFARAGWTVSAVTRRSSSGWPNSPVSRARRATSTRPGCSSSGGATAVSRRSTSGRVFQDDVPVRDAEVLRGHAVRALYLAAAAVDVAVDTDDAALLTAVERQLRRTLARRTYLTGGMGAHHEGESFGDDYELPPDRAYSETCAGVAAVMLAYRLLLATGTPAHADLIERVLYNVVATAVAQGGTAFFYTNPLHQRSSGTMPPLDRVSPRAASSLRAPWFAVSCCPTNVSRLLASLASYVAAVDEDGLYVHQYLDADIRTVLPDGGAVALRIRTGYPDEGPVSVEILESSELDWTLRLRVPGWATAGAVVTVEGETRRASPGTVAITRRFSPGDTVQLHLPMRARWTWADPRVDAVRGQAAVERGPIVYCLESVDLRADVSTARVRVDDEPVERDGAVLVPIETAEFGDPLWPYGPDATKARRGTGPRLVPLVPYHDWANRGPSTMRVWMPVAR